jgi:hypothetical protein
MKRVVSAKKKLVWKITGSYCWNGVVQHGAIGVYEYWKLRVAIVEMVFFKMVPWMSMNNENYGLLLLKWCCSKWCHGCLWIMKITGSYCWNGVVQHGAMDIYE